MIGFRALTRDIDIASTPGPSAWELTLLPFDEITRGLEPAAAAQPTSARSAPSSTRAAPAPGGGFQRAGVGPAARTPASGPAVSNPPGEEPGADAGQAADGFLINGSVNNGAASPFAQPSAFGNNRRRPGSLYNGGVGIISAIRRGTRARSRSPASRRTSRRTTTSTWSAPSAGRSRFRACANAERLRRLPAHRRSHDHHAVGADADCARARGRFLADARRVRPSGSDSRSQDGSAVPRQCDPRRPHQPAGGGAAAATTRSRMPRVVTITRRRWSRQSGRTTFSRECPNSSTREIRSSGRLPISERDRRVEPFRIRGRQQGVDCRRDGQLAAPLHSVRLAASALPVHSAGREHDAVFRQSHECVRPTPASPATIRVRRTGGRRA